MVQRLNNFISISVNLFLEYIEKNANFAVVSELGRYPFYLDIVKVMFKYWYRLGNFDESSLLHDALECLKAIDGCNSSWYKSF